jgi:hypothetical protein
VRLVPPLGVQLYVYGEVPPVAALAVALPVPPLQSIFVCEAIVIAIAVRGWVIVTGAVAVHPLLSVAVIV